jgi:hypothetical protein
LTNQAGGVDASEIKLLFQLPGWLAPHWFIEFSVRVAVRIGLQKRLAGWCHGSTPARRIQGWPRACEFSHPEIVALQVSMCHLREDFLFVTTSRSIFFLTSLRPVI